MSNVVVAMFLTLDGVMEDPGGGEGFQHGGWQLPFFDPDMATGVRDGLFAAGALLLGRVTYEQSAAAWASITDEEGFAERMNTMPKYVASTTLREPLAWNATLLDGDVPAAVAKLKQQPGGDLLVQGSGTLVRTLMQRNLIDAYQLWVHPSCSAAASGCSPTVWRRRRCSWSTPRRPAQGLSPSPTRRREPPRRNERPTIRRNQ